jgi:glycosyltransferase involved in cell wall biosynthesis
VVDPKYTVLVALYKSGPYIESKLLSLEKQTALHQAEIIFLNCGDHDRESVKVDEFIARYPNGRQIIFTEHKNLYETWNTGISQTTGQYITNYNADDQWHPKYLEKCGTFLDACPQIAIVSTGIFTTDIPNQVYPKWSHYGKMPSAKYPKSSAGPSPMWRRNLHDKYGLFGNYRVIGDAKFWEKLHEAKENFGLIYEDLVLYYVSPDSLERRRSEDGTSYIDLDLNNQ